MSEEPSAGLLRVNAVANKLSGPQSTPVIAIGSDYRLQFGFWLLFLIAATVLLTKTHYKETLPAKGVLVPQLGVQKIVAPTAARVEGIHVSLGDRVAEGDVLASLTTDAYNEQGRSINRQNLNQLWAEKRLLEEQLLAEKDAKNRSVEWSKHAVSNIRGARVELEKEADLLAEQIELSDRNLSASLHLLESGISSTGEYDKQYGIHLELLGRRQALSQREWQSRHELDALDNTQRLAAIEFERTIFSLRRELHALGREIESLEQQSVFTVVAERAGVVAELGLELGKPVRSQQILFYLNPLESEQLATMYVPSAVQGKLEIGQRVLLRYDAFDFRRYGRQEASVMSIGQAPLEPEDTPLPFGNVAEPLFRVTAQLESQFIEDSDRYQLQSGTALVADFVVADMSLLRFIFDPILRLRGKVT